jgi:hypothetical protein
MGFWAGRKIAITGDGRWPPNSKDPENTMRKFLARILLIGVALVPYSWGQGNPDQLNFLGANYEGFQFYGVTAFLNHTRFDSPSQNFGVTLAPRTNYGISGTVGWQRLHGKLNLSARYTGSYSGDVNRSDLSRPGHSGSLSISRSLGRKWSVEFAATGRVLTIEQYIFEPSALGILTQSQASIADMGAALSVGQFSSPQAGLLLGAANASTSPTAAILLGYNLLTYNATASLSYQHSSRLSFSFSSFTAGGQHLSGSSSLATNYVVPRTVGGTAGVTMNYSLTPRTAIEIGGSETYVGSPYQKAYTSGADIGISRKMSTHWFLRAHGGGSWSKLISQVAGIPPTLQELYGGSIGYGMRSSSILANYNRSSYDVGSGLIGKNTSISAAWRWHPLRSNWATGAGFGRNETTSTGFTTISGWSANGYVTRILPMNLVMTATFTHTDSKGVYMGIPNHLLLDGLRVSFGWTPNRRHVDPAKLDPIE